MKWPREAGNERSDRRGTGASEAEPHDERRRGAGGKRGERRRAGNERREPAASDATGAEPATAEAPAAEQPTKDLASDSPQAGNGRAATKDQAPDPDRAA